MIHDQQFGVFIGTAEQRSWTIILMAVGIIKYVLMLWEKRSLINLNRKLFHESSLKEEGQSKRCTSLSATFEAVCIFFNERIKHWRLTVPRWSKIAYVHTRPKNKTLPSLHKSDFCYFFFWAKPIPLFAVKKINYPTICFEKWKKSPKSLTPM